VREAPRAHGVRMACAWRVHGVCMACAWRVHGVCMACAWRAHGVRMACAWGVHGVRMACNMACLQCEPLRGGVVIDLDAEGDRWREEADAWRGRRERRGQRGDGQQRAGQLAPTESDRHLGATGVK